MVPFVKRMPLDELPGESKMLVEEARQASGSAYAPLSEFAVGAALLTEEGRVFCGCNVESEAFSPTSCAEVVACDKAVSMGHRRFRKIAVFSHDRRGDGRDAQPVSPCGRCRQKLLEFSDMEVIMTSHASNEAWVCLLSDLLPLRFSL